MGLWDYAKYAITPPWVYVDKAVGKGIFNETSDDITGGVNEGEGRLRKLESEVPQPEGMTPEEKSYLAQLRAAAGETPGAGYQTTPYYQQLQNDITEQMRREGWAAGNADASRGVMSPGSYGTGRLGAGEHTEMEARLRRGASSQAYQAQVQWQVQHYDQILKALGVEKGFQDTAWEQKMRTFLAKANLTEAEIQAEVEKMKMYADVGGLLLKGVAITATH